LENEPMTESLTKGGNIPWTHPGAVVEVGGLTAEASILAFLVRGDGKVRSEEDFVFFNNPSVPGVTITGHRAALDLPQVPPGIDRIVVAAVQDVDDPAPLPARPLSVTVGPDGPDVPVTGLTSERAVVLVEVYRRAQAWKLRNVSAGWTEGSSTVRRFVGKRDRTCVCVSG
jgi:tellurite resistance protein TerA